MKSVRENASRRRRFRLISSPAVLAAISLWPAAATHAASSYWDGDGQGVVGGGSGVWDTTSSRWSPTPGGSSYSLFNPADDAILPAAGGVVQIGTSANPSVSATSLTLGANYLLINPSDVVSTLSLGNGTIDTGSNNVQLFASLTGGAGLTKNGNGTLIIEGDNSYSGATTINGGTLAYGNTAVAGLPNSTDLTIAAGATMRLGIFNDTIGSLAGAGSVVLAPIANNGTTTGGVLTVGGNTTTGLSVASGTLSGVISGAGGRLVKNGDGTLTLTGTNSYGGTTTINGGVLAAGGGNAIPDASDVYFTTSQSGTTASQLNVSTDDETVGGLGGGQGSSSAFFGNSIQLGNNKTLTVGASNHNLEYDSYITGAGNITKIGTGTQIFANNDNDFVGTITVKGGLLIGSRTTSFGDPNNTIILDGGGIGNFFGTSVQVASTHAVQVTSNGGTIKADNGDVTYGGTISGTGQIAKFGTSNFLLTADQTSFTGGFRADSGRMEIRSASAGTVGSPATPLGTGPIHVGAARLNLYPTAGSGTDVFWGLASATAATTFNWSNGAILYLNRATAPATSKSFTVTLGNAGAAANSVFVPVPGKVLVIGSGADVLGSGGDAVIQLGNPTVTRLLVNGGVQTLTTNNSTATMVDPSVLVTGNDAFSLGEFLTYDATNGFKQATYVNGTTSASISATGNVTTLFNVTGGNASNNTLTGDTTVFAIKVNNTNNLNLNGFKLTVGDGVHSATIINRAAATISGAPGSVIDFGSSPGVLFSQNTGGVISVPFTGSAGLVKTGSGRQVLSAQSTYTGPTTIAFGSLTLGVNDALPTNTDLTIVSGLNTSFLNGSSFDLAGFSQTVGSLSSDNGGATVSLGNGGILTVGSSSSTFIGVITGTGSLVKNGTGVLTLGLPESISANPSRTNAFTRLQITGGGTVSIANAVSLGTVPTAPLADQIILDNGTLRITSADYSSMANGATSNFTPGTNRGIQLNAGGGTIQVTNPLEIVRIETNVVSGAGNLTKSGPGALRLGTNNTYTGKTIVTGGRLLISGDSSLGAAPGSLVADQLQVSGGALIQPISNVTLDANRGVTIGAGGASLSVSNTTAAAEAALTFNGPITGVGGLTVALSASSGAAAFNNNAVTFNAANSFAGDLTLAAGATFFNASGSAGNGSIVISPSAPVVFGKTGGVSDTVLSNAITLGSGATIDARVDSGIGNLQLNGKISGTGNLYMTAGGIAGIATAPAVTQGTGKLVLANSTSDFTGTVIVQRGTLAVAAANALGSTAGSTVITSAGTLAFQGGINYTAAEPVTLAGGALNNTAGANTFAGAVTLAADATIDIAAGTSLRLSGGISGASTLTKTGAGVGRDLEVLNIRATALNVSAGKVTVTPNSSGTGVSVLRNPSGTALTVSGTLLDLTDNKLILTDAVGTISGSTYTGVTGLIQSARNGGGWGGTSGITTSQTAATTGNYHSIGVARASDVRPTTATATGLWAGQTITGTDTLVMYTYGGDANLDGKINVDDYIKIDSGIAAGLTGWSNGDFNYDGKVNIDDYTTVIDANIGIQSGVFFTSGGLSGGPASAGLGVTAVPEPAALSLLIATIPIARRRRRSGR